MDHTSQKLENLLELAIVLGRQNDFQETLRVIVQHATALFDADIASIIMLNPATQHTIKTIIKEGESLEQKRLQLAQSAIAGWVLKNQQSFLSADLETDDRFSEKTLMKSGIRSAICACLQHEDNMIGCLLVLKTSQDGAFDERALRLLEKMTALALPFINNVQKIQAYFNPPLPEAALLAQYEAAGLLGKSARFMELLRAIDAAARCDVRVLLEGQSGTGKELIARAIHRFSSRQDRPFVAIDCGAIPENLLESELFGHVKGAFTGATSYRRGLIEEANHGTLFMDEVANLPLDMQAKLLRVLQEGEVRVVGSNKTRQVNVRIIAASSRSLRSLIEAQQFREDLFYRLHVYPIFVPSLKDRSDDIPLLAHHFLKKFSRQQKKTVAFFDESLLEYMQQRAWTGNIRELENFVERLVALASPESEILDDGILPADLQEEFKTFRRELEKVHLTKSLTESLEEYEKQLIRQALIKHDWSQAKAARALKIPPPTIRYKMSKLGIAKPPE